jgi:hypothetical protein
MEAEIPNGETTSELPLAEPHFDDEATVLSARRVVPLDKVPSYGSAMASRLARRWMFAAIVLGSLLLGVVGGAGYYSYLNRRTAQPLVDMEDIAAGVDAMSIEPAQNNDARMAANAPEAGNTTAADSNSEVTVKEGPPAAPPPSVSATEAKKPSARRVDVLASPSSDNEMLAREERRARKEARKRIRELERESRNPKSRNDLTRIRDIFEGPQKP